MGELHLGTSTTCLQSSQMVKRTAFGVDLVQKSTGSPRMNWATWDFFTYFGTRSSEPHLHFGMGIKGKPRPDRIQARLQVNA